MSSEKTCCKSDKWLLVVSIIIGISVIISVVLVFVPIDWPSHTASKFIVLYSVGFCLIWVFFFFTHRCLGDYCDSRNIDRELSLGAFGIFSIASIVLIFLIAGTIEQSYYESHFHNALEDNTLHQAYSELDCRIIDKFRSDNYENQPVWMSPNPNYIKNSLDIEHARYIIHHIPVPEKCSWFL